MNAMRSTSSRRNRFSLTGKSLVYAIGIHVVIGVLLFASFNFHSDNVIKPAAKPPVQPIQANAVTEAELQQQFDIIEERENRVKREKEQAEREVQELKKKQQQEAEKLAQIKKEQEIQKKKAEEEAKALAKKEEERKKAEIARKKKAEEEKKQAELARKKKEEEKRKAEIAKKKAEEEKKKKEELARKKKLEEEKRKKELALQQQLEQERLNSALNQYIPIIVQKVGRNWNQPGNLQRGITADVSVRLTAAGEVVSAQLTRSSGDSVFDRSVVNAVYKASPLPIPQERGVNERFRELTLKFNPEDLI